MIAGTPRDAGDDDFFVGWLPVPRSYVRFLLPAIALLLLGMAGTALLVAAFQRSPGSGQWETSTQRTFEGVVDALPYARVRVPGEKPGDPARTILLVEEGKFGAAERVRALDGQAVRVSGSLLHREAYWMLELAEGEAGVQPLATMPEAVQQQLRRPPPRSLGRVTLRGEIVDAKCYLGAMKPGGGKTHKACAVLCLSGGVPPLFVTRDAAAKESYSLLTAADGGPIEKVVLDFVGDPVELTGLLEQHGDGQVLKVAAVDIRRR